MDTAYRLGLAAVVGVVLASAAVALTPIVPRPASQPAGQDLGDRPFALGSFRLVERSGRVVTDADLADRVWVASFIFTRCPLSCPRITTVMKGLQSKLAGTGVQLVSLSVDPGRDTPAALADYAEKFGADPDRWWFLTGPPDEVRGLITGRFKLPVAPASEVEQAAGAEALLHSDRLVLVDRGNKVVGYFDSDEPKDRDAPKSLDALVEQARRRDVPAWARRLPAVNATLNGLCTLLLLAGWLLIRTNRARGHAACMVSAVAVSALFLGCYVVYHVQIHGGVPFRGVGPIRLAYFTILISHVVLAFTIVPLVAVTLIRALRRRFDRHARIAKVTFPIWLYVSITGVVIYLMLYQLPQAATSTMS